MQRYPAAPHRPRLGPLTIGRTRDALGLSRAPAPRLEQVLQLPHEVLHVERLRELLAKEGHEDPPDRPKGPQEPLHPHALRAPSIVHTDHEDGSNRSVPSRGERRMSNGTVVNRPPCGGQATAVVSWCLTFDSTARCPLIHPMGRAPTPTAIGGGARLRYAPTWTYASRTRRATDVHGIRPIGFRQVSRLFLDFSQVRRRDG